MEERMTLANMVIEAGGHRGPALHQHLQQRRLPARAPRLVRRVPRWAARHLRAHQRPGGVHLHHHPQLPRPHGREGGAGLPRLALHRRCLGGHRPHHRSAGAAPMTITGRVYVLGDNIDTDQIIPAEYLSLVPTIAEEYRKLGSYALAGLARTPDQPPFVPPGAMTTPYAIIVAGKNFGCGSSREHAPVALGAAGVKALGAESLAA